MIECLPACHSLYGIHLVSRHVSVAPTVVEFSPEDITVDEGDRVEFVCKANGSPSPAIKVVKVRPAPGKLECIHCGVFEILVS